MENSKESCELTPWGGGDSHKVDVGQITQSVTQYKFPEQEQRLATQPDEGGESEVVGEGGDGSTRRDNILWQWSGVIDYNVANIGNHEEEQWETELGSENGCTPSPQFSAGKKTRNTF